MTAQEIADTLTYRVFVALVGEIAQQARCAASTIFRNERCFLCRPGHGSVELLLGSRLLAAWWAHHPITVPENRDLTLAWHQS